MKDRKQIWADWWREFDAIWAACGTGGEAGKAERNTRFEAAADTLRDDLLQLKGNTETVAVAA